MNRHADYARPRVYATATVTLVASLLSGCAGPTEPQRAVEIQRTGHGVAHIEAPDYESLAYGVAYAHAEDNVCQTAEHLVTIRGERSRYFGAEEHGLLGLRMLPNETIDIFIRAHMDDDVLAAAQDRTSDEAQALSAGYVAGYNRYLRDHADDLPEPCAGKTWVRPMTYAEYLRIQELTMVQIGIALMADAMVAAAPPDTGTGSVAAPGLRQAVAALEDIRRAQWSLGSNGWAFGADVTTNGSGVLLGNPHFPWYGPNRFWQMHLTVPGELDVMGASIGHTAVVQIGFNHDVAWTHTVSTGKRYTLHELELVPGEPTRYLLDGREEAMTPVTVAYGTHDEQGSTLEKQHTVWNTHFGPVIHLPDAGLGWTETHAYALQDANAANMRAFDIWVGFNRATGVDDMKTTLANLGVPWVNTIAADRHGNALYADVSVVPDVDADHLKRCAPSDGAARLFEAAGIVVLNGSRTDCDWNPDPDSPVPGLLPIERMPVATRRDWVQNSNDSYWLTNPDIDWADMSPLIGPTNVPQRGRTRAGLQEIGVRLSAGDGIADHGEVGIAEAQSMLFANRNYMAQTVLDDLLAICEQGTEASREGCAVLAEWDRRNNLDSRGAHLFREWWRAASGIDNVWRVPFDASQPAVTPAGLNTADDAVREAVLTLLDEAVTHVRDAGFALDASLGDVQVRETRNGLVGLHGGDEFEGVLNKVETNGADALGPDGYRINFGSSYIQTVTFDDKGPVAEGMLTYGQATRDGSPLAMDQLTLYSEKTWPALPFHREDVARTSTGPVLRLVIDEAD